MTRALRTLAILIAVAAIVDPAFAVRRAQPPIVDVRVARAVSDLPHARDVQDRIRAMVEPTTTRSSDAPSAVVFIGSAADAVGRLPEGVPVSFVELVPTNADAIRIVRVTAPAVVLPGQVATVRAELEARGLAGRKSLVTLEQQGAELARVTVQWPAAGERQVAELAYAPPLAGVHELTVTAHSGEGAGNQAASAVDVALIVESRELRVLTFEPRPSWAAGFARRAVEADPVFASTMLARASRGIDVRAGEAPVRLTAAALEPFDAVIVGAPEALSGAEVEALAAFARIRGGAIVLLPDRRPSGPYVRLLPVDGFDEVLVEAPLTLQGSGSAALRATELALPRDLGRGASAIASVRLHDRVRPVIVSWPLGNGQLVFSGALDAWRYRADDGAAFARFWTGLVANLAAAAPRPLTLSVEPALARPGDPLTVRAAVRQTEWTAAEARIDLPAVGAVLIGEDGTQQQLRLWPTAETGVFEGRIMAERSGRFHVRASAGALSADAPVIIAEGARKAAPAGDERFRVIAAATGGVAVSASELGALDQHLRALSPSDSRVTTRPMRSGWWMVAFAGALCAEWGVRRRRGLR